MRERVAVGRKPADSGGGILAIPGMTPSVRPDMMSFLNISVRRTNSVIDSYQHFGSDRAPGPRVHAEGPADHPEPDFERPSRQQRCGQRRILVDCHPDEV